MSAEEQTLNAVTTDMKKKIKKRMLEKGFSQQELADLLRESKSTISAAINGYPNEKSVAVRKAIFKILGMEGE